ncbi:pinensin family lanthipeptide [Xanthovirga aplysinae]|uniref:pinensin family lanthipeptide n=1 Tax=Xanthovirga aplysinae TaxID=2529853 RepID=UPI0012BC445B|nr:pinensin family lanthipeptide [Xanthovirga aplysinae]
MKKKKLTLSDLKLESFVTSLDYGKENTIKGGAPETFYCKVSVEIPCTPETRTDCQ